MVKINIMFIIFIFFGYLNTTLAAGKKPFELPASSMGNSKTIIVKGHEADVTAEALSTSENHDHHASKKLNLKVSIQCKGSDKPRLVPLQHKAFKGIFDKKTKQLVLCALGDVDMSALNLHLIVYKQNDKGQCLSKTKSVAVDHDVVIPIISNNKVSGKGFCD